MKFPQAFLDLLNSALPSEHSRALLEALEQPAPVSIRINQFKAKEFIPAVESTVIPWCDNAYYLQTRPLFSADPLFHAGAYYVQEASSMITGLIVNWLTKETAAPVVLDLCAAPGGKSTHIADVLLERENGLLVANEVISGRNRILQENLIKWGHANHLITRADASLFGNSTAMFDVIVADMPCSGEGMFRKDPEAIDEWSENNVYLCADRQMRIAADVWPALKTGGYLIYSTCTYNRLENEENIKRIATELGADVVKLDQIITSDFYQSEAGMYRALPHLMQGEGFFISVLQKTAATGQKKARIANKSGFIRQSWFNDSEMAVHVFKGETYGLRAAETNETMDLLNALPGLVMPGIPLGRDYHGIFKPDASLALYGGEAANNWPEWILNDLDAMKYFRRESLPNTQALKGIYRATFQGINLGWLNGVKLQWNNLWPMDWRLRMNVSEPATILERFN